MENKKDHLPLFGVGPAIVFGQFGMVVACWVYMTIFLIYTEEKWLSDL